MLHLQLDSASGLPFCANFGLALDVLHLQLESALGCHSGQLLR